jgi:hypothetical protein
MILVLELRQVVAFFRIKAWWLWFDFSGGEAKIGIN